MPIFGVIGIFCISRASPTTVTPVCDKDELTVNLDVEKLAKEIGEVYSKQKCICETNNVSSTSSLSLISQNKSDTSLDILYANQIEDIDDGAEISIVWILYGKPIRAAKRFNSIPNNIRYIKLIVDDIIEDSHENLPKLMKFVDFIDGYEQKILMSIVLYREFMKTIDVGLLPEFKALVVKLMTMNEFNALGNYYKDQIETMKSVLEALNSKVETLMPREKPELITLEQVKESLHNLTNSLHDVKNSQMEIKIGQKNTTFQLAGEI